MWTVRRPLPLSDNPSYHRLKPRIRFQTEPIPTSDIQNEIASLISHCPPRGAQRHRFFPALPRTPGAGRGNPALGAVVHHIKSLGGLVLIPPGQLLGKVTALSARADLAMYDGNGRLAASHAMELTLNLPKLRRKYLWVKSGGLCWYCGARLYSPGEANTEAKKQLIFTADHVHPRSRGGRGRTNKVPACKYCNSHKSSRSVEEFREWLQARVFDEAKHPRTPASDVTRRWKINAEAVVFYFELARLSDSGLL
jgi:HNH endonuclease